MCRFGDDSGGSSIIFCGVVPFARWPLLVVTGIIIVALIPCSAEKRVQIAMQSQTWLQNCVEIDRLKVARVGKHKQWNAKLVVRHRADLDAT